MGSPGDPLARRTGLHRSLDRRAPYRAVGAAPLARPAGRAGADADQEHPPRARRLPVALPSPRRARQPRRHARPHLGRTAQFRHRRLGPAERLGDVQRRRHVGRQSRHDPRGAGDHPEALELTRAVRLQGQVLACHQTRHDVRVPEAAHQAAADPASADRRRRPVQGLRHASIPPTSAAIGNRSRSALPSRAAHPTATTGAWYARFSWPTPTKRR